MAESFDTIVVGAGPAGAVAARELARGGRGPVLLLDRAQFPRLKPCAGGLSPLALRLLDELGLGTVVRPRAYPIRGLRLVSPNGADAVVHGPDSAAILNRRELDALLVDAAVAAGVQLRTEAKVNGLIFEAGRVAGVRCADREFAARWVLAAGGANDRLARDLDAGPGRVLRGCIAWFDNLPFTAHHIEMIYDPTLLPHYGWLFPEPGGRVNIGLCLDSARLGGRSLRALFNEFLVRHFAGRMGRAVQVGELRGHPISTTARIEHHAPPGCLRIGEANHLTNPATGEGIAYALASGRLAAQAICDGERAGRSAPEIARWYLGKLRRGMELRCRLASLFCRLAPPLLNWVTALGNHPLVDRLAGGAFSRV
jgi:geranylgeranyl reductase family protein